MGTLSKEDVLPTETGNEAAQHELRAKIQELIRQGKTDDEIQAELNKPKENE
jgi:hypothetical protein